MFWIMRSSMAEARSVFGRVLKAMTPLAYRIVIEDNGPGISIEKQEYVLQRGARADTLVQGQGIGLAVVTDIVASYGGTIEVGSSNLGGAKITMRFVSTRQGS